MKQGRPGQLADIRRIQWSVQPLDDAEEISVCRRRVRRKYHGLGCVNERYERHRDGDWLCRLGPRTGTGPHTIRQPDCAQNDDERAKRNEYIVRGPGVQRPLQRTRYGAAPLDVPDT